LGKSGVPEVLPEGKSRAFGVAFAGSGSLQGHGKFLLFLRVRKRSLKEKFSSVWFV
jgi:hypothetical protein